MSEPTAAVRYFTVPNDLEIQPGIGWRVREPVGAEMKDIDGGTVTFARFFMATMLGTVAKMNDEPAEEFLSTRLRRAMAGARIEIPEAIWAVLVSALPTGLAQSTPDLYDDLRPFIRAVRTVPSVKPADW